MNQLREPDFDRVVVLVLRTGAFGCFVIILAGLAAAVFVPGRIPLEIERANVAALVVSLIGSMHRTH